MKETLAVIEAPHFYAGGAKVRAWCREKDWKVSVVHELIKMREPS